ncbi:hypothetical protein CVIRNUC_006874 [Coccomyxa viridis]|uniref:RING-type E3 ubiquitin transferase n=1 Tax=Coccomyxa viridis TaxID=1274662 RepID=A0AAV1IBI9_9CHLO|nr:hypothetical protein CVIRNUC_006874 [Coccomyxa viridis]
MEDCCAVCAEPLEWTAYGPCGHTEACSKCVMRLRFVMDDKRCVICQQINPCVLVTRFMGSYTSTLPASEFPQLGKMPGLDYLASTQAYFDDKVHFIEIRGLCSFSHPELADDGGQMVVFRSIHQLKRQLVDTRNKQLCNICVESRKVFIPEQVAYSKPDLERHMRTGDLTGPMAESGFKGHPQCRFCRSRFFGDSELFIHMQSAHEQCFLCRRAQPDRYVYYKDYNELEDHFRHEHYLCNHQTCLDRKFIVFMTEQELKQHAAREHGGDLSKAERRQALTIPINFQYSRGQEAAGAPERGRHDAGAPGRITIGGSGHVRSRFGQRGHEDNHQHLSSAIHASVESAQTEEALRASASAQDLQSGPTPAEAAGEPHFTGPRHYLAAAGSRGGGNLRAEDFPALPGTSKSARKRTNQKHRLGSRRSTSDSDLAGASASALELSSHSPGTQEDAGPVREPEWQEVRAPAQRQLAQQQRLSKLQGRAAAAAAATNGVHARQLEAPESFPSLSASSKPAKSSRTISPRPGRPAYSAAGLPASEGAAAAPRGAAADAFPALGPSAGPAQQAPLNSWGPGSSAPPLPRSRSPSRGRKEDFPALGGFPVRGSAALSPLRPPAPQPAAVSDSIKAANKALMKRIKTQLSEEQLDQFRAEASSFLQGGIGASAYHELVVSLGLGSLVPEMAALLPDPDRRAELLSVHSAAQQAEQDLAADAAAAHAMQFGSWQCSRCSLINGPDTRSCEACNTRRPQGVKPSSSNSSAEPAEPSAADGDGFPSLSSAPSDAKQPKKGKKVSKFERLRLTGGDPEATLSWIDTEGGRKPPTNPQNAWTQGAPAVNAGGGGSQPRGQWSKQGKLGHEWRTVQDAWSKK